MTRLLKRCAPLFALIAIAAAPGSHTGTWLRKLWGEEGADPG